jgi:deoxyribonuclease V
MHIRHLHEWIVTPKQAMDLQLNLAQEIILKDEFSDIKFVAGIDVGFPKDKNTTQAAIAILEYDSLNLVESQIVDVPTTFPYIPGLLSFREIPAIIETIKNIKIEPDIVLCDGQGIAHPRKFGLASHLGLILNKPMIGVAKSRLTGKYNSIPQKKGKWNPLLDDQDEVIGAVLCTRDKVKPLFISPGHKISLQSSINIVMACITRYRLPETTRCAHTLASKK